MSNIYNVFNTNNDAEFSKFLDKLDLTTNDLLNVVALAESSNDIKTKQQNILEYMAGTTVDNYELCVNQFKPKFKRVLKENEVQQSQLSLNQIMELNDLVDLVASKLSAPNCMKGIFNIIKSKSNANVANAFLGMVQQSSVNDSKLKFNTELQINGQNLAQIIYQLKNDIEIFANSLECPKKVNEEKQVNEVIEAKPNMLNDKTLEDIKSFAENNGLIYQETVKSPDGKSWLKFISRPSYFNVKQFEHYAKKHFNNIEVKKGSTLLHTHRKIVYITFDMPLNEAEDMSFNIVSKLNQEIDKTNDSNALQIIIKKINDLIKAFKETDTQNILSSLKSRALTKMGEMNNASPKIEECVVQQLVSDVCGENTFDNLLNNLKPTMISITVNNENGDFENCVEDFAKDLPQCSCDVLADKIENDVQPSSAEAYNALNALSSHLNCQKSDCAENNLEELQSINTLLAQLSNYFNGVLSENCSAGATCAASVGTIATPFKQKKKRKKETLDYSMFKENVSNNIPSSLEINGKTISYEIIEGKNYLYIDNGILKTTNKQSIMEALDDLYNDCLEMEVLEGFNHYELDLLLEDNMITPTTSSNQQNQTNPQDEKELDNQIRQNSNLKVTVKDEKSNTSTPDQEIVGIDDSDINNKMYVTKDPKTGKVKVTNSQNISLQGLV